MAEKTPQRVLGVSRTIQVLKMRLAKHLSQFDSALNSVLHRSVAGVEGGDRIVLRSAKDRLHLADRAFKNRASGQTICRERGVRRRDGILVTRNFLSKFGHDGAGV